MKDGYTLNGVELVRPLPSVYRHPDRAAHLRAVKLSAGLWAPVWAGAVLWSRFRNERRRRSYEDLITAYGYLVSLSGGRALVRTGGEK